jgi:hypothetical protein
MPNQATLPGGGQPGHTSRIHVDQQRVSLATSGFRQPAKCQTGQSGDTAQAVQSVDRVSPPLGGNHGDDLLFEAIPRRRHAQYGIEVAIEGRRGVTVVDALPTGHVSCNRSKGCPLNTLGLGAAAVWQPVPYSHQAGAGIFAGPDEITYRFDIAFGHGDRGDLTQAQQPGQLCAVAGVGVGPIPARPDQLRPRSHHTLNVVPPI